MDIRTEIDGRYTKIELHVCNNELTDEVRGIMRELHEIYDRYLSGTDEWGNRCMLVTARIVSAYAEGQKVFVRTDDGIYSVQNKLYELEKELGESSFVRISKSEIVNIKKIRSLDLSVTGTIRITMKDGYEAYVSRRNVAKIKEKLLSGRQVKQA
jgi:hypothetical protein